MPKKEVIKKKKTKTTTTLFEVKNNFWVKILSRCTQNGTKHPGIEKKSRSGNKILRWKKGNHLHVLTTKLPLLVWSHWSENRMGLADMRTAGYFVESRETIENVVGGQIAFLSEQETQDFHIEIPWELRWSAHFRALTMQGARTVTS